MNRIQSFICSGMLLCCTSAVFAQQDNSPLHWTMIKEKDVLWKKRVLRDIDANAKQNTAFRYAETNAGTNLLAVLLNGVKNGSIKAYGQADDRFTHEMSPEEITAATGPETVAEKNINPVSGAIEETNVSVPFAPEMIYKFRIKEDWIFDKAEGKMVIRIIGIAPLKPVVTSDGTTAMQPLFWLYYPDAARAMAGVKTREGVSWLDVFEKRMFASDLIKILTPFGLG